MGPDRWERLPPHSRKQPKCSAHSEAERPELQGDGGWGRERRGRKRKGRRDTSAPALPHVLGWFPGCSRQGSCLPVE